MPLQNRVTPFGEIVAIPERGTLMGIRGILHDADGRIRRRWAGRAWISCLLEFRGRRATLMAPNHYTQLFFLDEPTAFAAGHRPCGYCRRTDYMAFRDTWARANAHLGLGARPLAPEIDRVLHAERLTPSKSKRLHAADLASLPDGVMVATAETDTETAGGAEAAFLVWRGELWRWSAAGYAPADRDVTGPVLTLTPPSIIATLAAGYPTMPPAGLSPLTGRPAHA